MATRDLFSSEAERPEVIAERVVGAAFVATSPGNAAIAVAGPVWGATSRRLLAPLVISWGVVPKQAESFAER